MKRGWCPGVHAPMPSGDGLLIRVTPFGGTLSGDALRMLAVVAAGCGNGVVELTNRGNIQLRGLTAVTAPLAARALVEAGLADPDPVREARRNVKAMRPRDDDPVAAAGLLLGVPFGQTDAAAILRLADLTAGAVLRTTRSRSFFLAGAHDPAPFAAAGFITDPDDPRRSIAACAGAPACASASVPARADAAFLAARGLRGIHVSGCAKGCAHPNGATTLVGSGGTYGFIRHGRAGDRPTVTGLSIAQAAEMLT